MGTNLRLALQQAQDRANFAYFKAFLRDPGQPVLARGAVGGGGA
jgi:hypothetical protein